MVNEWVSMEVSLEMDVGGGLMPEESVNEWVCEGGSEPKNLREAELRPEMRKESVGRRQEKRW